MLGKDIILFEDTADKHLSSLIRYTKAGIGREFSKETLVSEERESFPSNFHVFRVCIVCHITAHVASPGVNLLFTAE